MDQQTHNDQIAAIRREALIASGSVTGLRRRARGYLDLYSSSNGVCLFALVAAQGSLWASWYLVCAKVAAMVFAVVDISCWKSPRRKYAYFADYVLTLKEINQLVMVETYVLIHTIQNLGPQAAIGEGVPSDLVNDYTALLKAENPSAAMLRDIYHRHFLWEQERVVSTKLDEAFARFSWPLMRSLCQRPWVWFSYFEIGKSMNFKEFTNQEERVEKGLIAYDRAVNMGAERLYQSTDRRLRRWPGYR